MKKILFLISLLFGLSVFTLGVEAQSPDDIIPEPTCIAYNVYSARSIQQPCNTVCKRECIDASQNCPFNDPNTCTTITELTDISENTRENFNIFGVELCPDSSQRPPDDPYCTLIIVRMVFYAVISLLVFVLIVMALWVVWERSTAADNPEKVEKAATIAKNAIIGAVITFLFIAIVQVASLILGLTGKIFDITIVPQPRQLGLGESCDIGEYAVCQVGKVCVDNGAGFICMNP
jgi:hypothetical protein